MIFPFFGDAEAFWEMGAACARSMEGVTFEGCYNGTRPVGAIIYFAIAHLLTDDPINARYVLVSMNVAAFMLLCAGLLKVAELVGVAGGRAPLVRYGVMACALILCVPFFPVALSDVPAVAAFVGGLGLLLQSADSRRTAFFAGLLLGMSCLFKQNYYVFSALAFAAYVAANYRLFERRHIASLAAFSIGGSISLIQFYLVYRHTGHLSVYDPLLDQGFNEIRKLPVIELVAISLPGNGAYLSSVDTTALSAFSHFCIKLLQGFFAYRPAVYLGAPPVESPAVMHASSAFLVKAYAATAAVVIVLGAATWLSATRARTLLLLALASTLFTAWYIHVENRYFLMPKLLIATWFVAAALPAWLRQLARSFKGAAAMQDLPAAGERRACQMSRARTLAMVSIYAAVLVLCFFGFQHDGLARSLASIAGRFAHVDPSAVRIAGGVLVLAKLVLVAAFFAVAWITARVGDMLELPGKRTNGMQAAAVFASSPFAIFAVFFMASPQVLGALLVVLALYWLVQRRVGPSWLAFLAAAAFTPLVLVLLIPFAAIARMSWSSDAGRHRAMILWGSASLAAGFAVTGWRPERLIVLMPIVALATLYLRRPAIFFVAEVVATGAFVWVNANMAGSALDTDMLQAGAFRKLFTTIHMHVADLIPAWGTATMRAVLAVFLLTPLVVYVCETCSATVRERVDAASWIPGRWMACMLVLVWPVLYCAFAGDWQTPYSQAQAALSRLQPGLHFDEQQKTLGELTADHEIRQEFVADGNGLTAIAVRFATYGRPNAGTVTLTLKNSLGAVVASDTVDAAKLRDNQFHGFRFARMANSAGHRFVLSISTSGGVAGKSVTIWTEGGEMRDDKYPAFIDNARLESVLNFKLLYAP